MSIELSFKCLEAYKLQISISIPLNENPVPPLCFHTPLCKHTKTIPNKTACKSDPIQKLLKFLEH